MHPYLYAHYSYIFSLPFFFLGFEAHTPASGIGRQWLYFNSHPSTPICPSLLVAAHLSPLPEARGCGRSRKPNRAFAQFNRILFSSSLRD